MGWLDAIKEVADVLRRRSLNTDTARGRFRASDSLLEFLKGL
jgi:hypothetical protein